MADRTLKSTVHVAGGVYLAGSTPPPEVAKLITNPKAWNEPEPRQASAAPAHLEQSAVDARDEDGDEAAKQSRGRSAKR